MKDALFCLVVWLACGSVPVTAQSIADKTPVVVFVHGRNQAVDSLAPVRKAFIGSFERAQIKWLGQAIVPDKNMVFVWYADAIDPKSERLPTNGACNFAEDESEEAKTRRKDVRDDLLGLAQALHLDGLALRTLTGDTYKYLTSGSARCDADSRLAAELDGRGLRNRPLIIVAHSMGGIVALASIKRNAESLTRAGRFDIIRLVTVGTQVGQPIILRGLFGSYVQVPVPEPNTIKSWRNFMNEGDKLAFPARKSFMATNGARRPEDIAINTPGDRHAATNYLADRKVLRAILWKWCAAQPSQIKPTKCAAVESEGDVH